MTNTPNKSEMKALRYIAVTPTPEQREAAHDFYSANGDCVLIWANQGDLDLIEFPPPSRPPADQVPDMVERDNCQICRGANGGVPGNENVICGVVVCDYCDAATRPFQASSQAQSDDVVERVARAHSPETWATIDELRSKAAWYREKIGKVGYRDGSAEREAESNQRLADKYANEQITRARAALAALQAVPAAIPPADQVPDMRNTLECARRDLNHLAAKYDEQEFVAPTICKIAALQAVPAAGESEPTDAMVEAGCEAMHKVHAAMRDRNLSDEPETMDDFDEGDICRAVYLAMRSAASDAGWQPIESAPKDGKLVVLWQREHGLHVARWSEAFGDWHGTDWEHTPALDPTHWMRPEPPALKAQETGE